MSARSMATAPGIFEWASPVRRAELLAGVLGLSESGRNLLENTLEALVVSERCACADVALSAGDVSMAQAIRMRGQP